MKPFPGHHALGTPERLFNQKLSSSPVAVDAIKIYEIY